MSEINQDSFVLSSLDLGIYIEKLFDFLKGLIPVFGNIFGNAIGFAVGISIPLSIIFFIGIIISVERLKAIRRAEEDIYNAKADMGYDEKVKGNHEMSSKWDAIQLHVESENHNDWRQAIIEADILLGDILTKIGYRGETIGEQLKRANINDFKTRDLAWEAHLVRNRIAHDGANYPLNQIEARRVIALYKQVFEEFYFL